MDANFALSPEFRNSKLYQKKEKKLAELSTVFNFQLLIFVTLVSY